VFPEGLFYRGSAFRRAKTKESRVEMKISDDATIWHEGSLVAEWHQEDGLRVVCTNYSKEEIEAELVKDFFLTQSQPTGWYFWLDGFFRMVDRHLQSFGIQRRCPNCGEKIPVEDWSNAVREASREVEADWWEIDVFCPSYEEGTGGTGICGPKPVVDYWGPCVWIVR
jgi:hypothetical protein